MAEDLLQRKSATASDESNPYWISFADIMAGLLAIFILAVVLLILQLKEREAQISKAIQEIQQINELRETILEEIKDELETKGIRVVISEDKTVLRIPEDLLAFESRQYAIPFDRRELVGEIGRVLFKYVTKDDRTKSINTIFIEGHTDSRPARGFLEGLGNWGLSSARSISVWRYWSESLENGDEFKKLTNEQGEKMFSVSGYAATRRLVSDDDTPEEQRANRRIDIRLSMRNPVLKDYESIRDEF